MHVNHTVEHPLWLLTIKKKHVVAILGFLYYIIHVEV